MSIFLISVFTESMVVFRDVDGEVSFTGVTEEDEGDLLVDIADRSQLEVEGDRSKLEDEARTLDIQTRISSQLMTVKLPEPLA